MSVQMVKVCHFREAGRKPASAAGQVQDHGQGQGQPSRLCPSPSLTSSGVFERKPHPFPARHGFHPCGPRGRQSVRGRGGRGGRGPCAAGVMPQGQREHF